MAVLVVLLGTLTLYLLSSPRTKPNGAPAALPPPAAHGAAHKREIAQRARAAAMFERISASRSAAPLAAFAGGALPHTLLSACAGALLPFLCTRSALPLRATCQEAAAAVAQHPWEDMDTVIHGHLGPTLLPGRGAPGTPRGAWRACFPRARGANVAGGHTDIPYETPPPHRAALVDADAVHLAGLHTLNVSWCTALTDAAFAHRPTPP